MSLRRFASVLTVPLVFLTPSVHASFDPLGDFLIYKGIGEARWRVRERIRGRTRTVYRIGCIAALLFVFAAPSARAFFDPPWITPTDLRAGEVVSVNIRGGVCDSIFFRPGYPQITLQGKTIRILEYGHHWDTADLCIYDIGTLIAPIGAFPPGEYTLAIDFVYEDYPNGYTTANLGVVPFVVTGVTSAAPVPALGATSATMLVVFVVGATMLVLRSRPRRRRWRHG